jgi:hypothetical protein
MPRPGSAVTECCQWREAGMTATVARRLGLSTNIVDCRAATIKRPQPHSPQLVSTSSAVNPSPPAETRAITRIGWVARPREDLGKWPAAAVRTAGAFDDRKLRQQPPLQVRRAASTFQIRRASVPTRCDPGGWHDAGAARPRFSTHCVCTGVSAGGRGSRPTRRPRHGRWPAWRRAPGRGLLAAQAGGPAGQAGPRSSAAMMSAG